MAGKTYNLKTILSVVDRLSPTLKSVGAIAKKTAGNIDALKAAAKGVGAACTDLSDRAGLVSRAMGNLGTAAGLTKKRMQTAAKAVAGVFATAVAASVHAAVAFSEYASALSDASKRSGVAVEALQKLRYAADSNGSSAATMDAALIKLNGTLYDAAHGKNKNAALLFRTLGISIRGANGEARNAADVLPQLAEGFRRNENASVRTRMAMDLFGKSGAELLPLLSQGSAAFDEASRRAKKYGFTVSTSAVDAGASLNDSLSDLKINLNATVGTIAGALTPAITDLANSFMEWTAANRDWIAQDLAGAFSMFANIAKGGRLKHLVELLGAIAVWWATLKAMRIAKGIYSVGVAIASLTPAVLSFAKALTPVATAAWAAFGPIGVAAGLAAAAIAGLSYVVYTNMDSIRAFIGKCCEAISGAYDAACEAIGAAINRVISYVGVIKNAWGGIVGWFSSLWARVEDIFAGAVKQIRSLVPQWMMDFFTQPGAKTNFRFSGEPDSDNAPAWTSSAMPWDRQSAAEILRPNASAMSASGTVRGAVDINVHTDDGRTEIVRAPVNGAVSVSGNPGVMRGAYGASDL